MEELIKSLPASVQVLIIMVLGWFFKEYWEDRKDKKKTQDEALNKNTLAIVELQVQIKNLAEVLSILPKFKQDLDYAHEKIRDLNGSPKV